MNKGAAGAPLLSVYRRCREPSGDLAAALLGDDQHGGTRWHGVLEVWPAGSGILERRRTLIHLARVLNREEERLVVGREERAAQLAADRHAEEVLGRAAPFAFGFEGPEAIRPACRLGVVAVGGDPEASLAVDGAVVRHAEPAVL